MPVLKQIPKVYRMCCFPIVMLRRSACTNDLVDFIETEILQGISFLKICEGIAALNFKEFKERSRCLSLSQAAPLPDSQCQWDSFYEDQIYSFPGNNKITEIFLADFLRKECYYEEEMKNIARYSTSLSCDHTFKISKYICASRGVDGEYVRQFENLFIMLNEEHQVVGWKLTKSTAFSEITTLLQNIKETEEGDLQSVIVDDCCKVRAQYQSIFAGVMVKLDLFHATQRIIKTLPKGTESSRQMSKEVGLIFRDSGDCGETRTLPTPDPQVMERNLDNFLKRWAGTLKKENQINTFKEFENLRVHIKKGCLSGIYPGQGTECNERLHQTLNKSLLCGATTIGPEIAIAILSLIFYAVNCKKQGRRHVSNAKVVPFVPLPSSLIEEDSTSMKRSESALNNGKKIQLDNVWRACQMDKNRLDQISTLIYMILLIRLKRASERYLTQNQEYI